MGNENINFADIRHKIRENADKCVKCALCLPHCPTYKLRREEGESPRGRLSLMTAIADSQLTADGATAAHLDNCLDCRACEIVCPANVPYGEILTATRFLQASLSGPLYQSLSAKLAIRISRWSLTRLFLTAISAIRMRQLLRYLPGTAGRLFRSLPTRFPRVPSHGIHMPAQGEATGRVALFMGCSAVSLDTQTLNDSVQLLTAAGFEVEIPSGQQCCGALAAHAGKREESSKLCSDNQKAFDRNRYDAIVVTATGCAAHLKDREQQSKTAIVTQEICQFLHDTKALGPLQFDPLEKTVLLHTPCTGRNVLRNRASTQHLLQHIPGIQLIEPASHNCCGGAGSYFLNHADAANKLASELLNSIDLENVSSICTSNYGCGMHMRANMAFSDRVEIQHPVSLLLQQLSANK